MRRRNFILGLDGVPYKLINDLSEKGIMPNFKELKDNFTFKEMKSTIPHISSVSWSSIITGVNPGEHGIYGFTELIPNSYTLSFPNFNALKAKPFWLKFPQKKHLLINVPSTYPARILNGIHIAGFVALNLEKAVYPKSIIPFLREIKYEIDLDTKLAHQQSEDILINELKRILKIRKEVYNNLWKQINWDNFLFVITGTDRISHFLWHIYEDIDNKYHQMFLDYFHEVDNIVGDIRNKLKEDDTFIILSDHGMEFSKQNINLNTYLQSEDHLQLSPDLKNYNRITKESKAFILDPGRVYLNKVNKYPRGSITPKEEEDVLEDLKSIFYDLEFEGQKVIKKIYTKEQIYKGSMLHKAPDLLLIENPGFQLKGSIGKEELFEKDEITGKHNNSAFILINNNLKLEDPSVENVLNLMS